MPVYPNRRLRSTIVDVDRAALFALHDITDYRPHNAAFSREQAVQIEAKLVQAQQAEARAVRVVAAARDATQQIEWELHEAVLGVKAEVTAQYRANSDQIQSLGIKKKSERKRPTRRVRVIESESSM